MAALVPLISSPCTLYPSQTTIGSLDEAAMSERLARISSILLRFSGLEIVSNTCERNCVVRPISAILTRSAVAAT